MIRIADKSRCCGCTACHAICPHDAITMKADALGFPYPVVDEERCVDCGLCEKACPYLKDEPYMDIMSKVSGPSEDDASTEGAVRVVYAAMNEDEKVRNESSSGGVFALVAAKVLADGGWVYGAAFAQDVPERTGDVHGNNAEVHIGTAGEDKGEYGLRVLHCGTDVAEEVKIFCGSKYVQSDMGECFREVSGRLAEGQKVLFTGTPCQIAGLRSYVGKRNKGLYTMACACHGVPSPEVWKRYSAEVLGRCQTASDGESRGAESEEKIRVTFRDKATGWKTYRIRIGDYVSPAFNDPYMKAMLKGLTLRPSCRDCVFKGKDVGADLLVGDWWGIARLAPEMDDDKGTSALVVNTPEGEWLLSDGGLKLKKMPLLDDPGNGGFNKRTYEASGNDAGPGKDKASQGAFDDAKFAADIIDAESIWALLKSMTDATLKEKIIRRLKKYFKI